ncbi:hypothetical protein SAMN05660284_02514 [Formivibrio citricus]|uniref:Uncharacterized protein n=1 Tax=Formivibrio citricus TaxID=83765 RepID=A0A1I5CWE8_9NEIS|nr:hypothetical protein [Formivibrio citricus]SFN91284.1 hypothetical protein SAMN05660284_02514 [Formivibrio citricus]
MSAFERFLAGEDALARLIRAQPAFEPSADQEARLLAAISNLSPVASQDFEFEPPARMEAVFLQEMHAAQQAQAPRRDALLSRLQAGEAITELLGHPVSGATQAWITEQQPSPVAVPASASPRPRSRWWELGGLVFAGTMIAVVGMQFFFPPQPAQQAHVAINSHASAPQVRAPQQLAKREEKAVLSRIAPPPVMPRRAKTQPSSLGQEVNPPLTAVAPTGERVKGEENKQVAVMDSPAMVVQERSYSRNAEFSARMPQELERQPLKAAIPAPAPMLEAARTTALASPRRIVLLTEDPAEVAHGLSPDWARQALIVQAADPQSPAVQSWVERLRAALPPGTRLTLQPRVDMEPDRIVLICP